MNRAERNYCVTDKELLAVKNFVEHHKHHLLGRKFLIRTDHQALKWLFSLREPKNRIARWIEILSAYDFTVEYRPGKRHGNADALSRCPNPTECACPTTADENMLKCGPCNRCNKRTDEMQSSLQDQPSPQTINKVTGQPSHSPSLMARAAGKLRVLTTVLTTLLCLRWFSWTFQDKKQDKPNSSITTSALAEDVPSKIEPFDERPNRWYSAMVNNLTTATSWAPFAHSSKCRRVQTRSSNKKTDIPVDNTPASPSLATKQPAVTRKPVTPLTGRGKPSNKPSWASNYSMASLRKKQESDPDIGPILRWKESGTRPYGTEVCATSPTTRHYWNSWDILEIYDGVLFRRFQKRDRTGNHRQFLVPRSIKNEILEQMHGSLLSGHLGRKKSREKTLRFYWHGV